MDRKKSYKTQIVYGYAIFLLCIPYTGYSQFLKRQCISSYGSITINNNILISQTVGQSYITGMNGENEVKVLQGFQQPTVFSVKSSNTLSETSLDLKVFPNPAYFTVNIQSNMTLENATINITDIQGKNILSNKISKLTSYSINCEQWESGVYFITICDDLQNKRTLRIVLSK